MSQWPILSRALEKSMMFTMEKTRRDSVLLWGKMKCAFICFDNVTNRRSPLCLVRSEYTEAGLRRWPWQISEMWLFRYLDYFVLLIHQLAFAHAYNNKQ